MRASIRLGLRLGNARGGVREPVRPLRCQPWRAQGLVAASAAARGQVARILGALERPLVEYSQGI